MHRLSNLDGLRDPICGVAAPARLYAVMVRIVLAGIQKCVSLAKKSLGPASSGTGRYITLAVYACITREPLGVVTPHMGDQFSVRAITIASLSAAGQRIWIMS